MQTSPGEGHVLSRPALQNSLQFGVMEETPALPPTSTGTWEDTHASVSLSAKWAEYLASYPIATKAAGPNFLSCFLMTSLPSLKSFNINTTLRKKSKLQRPVD